ncbi:3-oxoacyl-reductase [Desulfocucumis palustris]|uniref:3-oxoacyl-reductase n=1 Tax=Desulfocucumis palustris TaxID=1898651 RepID=A0A2L2X9V4_9FIRM|nr:SDR family NAD(P)-dependent oxidoreductase [Desulfocucumis palustris]GBF33057.1 3-oxoacyl-reductase [Desulfocucumis palustris]
MEKMLKDKVCIITGSGRGIGKAAALLFAREGAKLAITDIDEAPALETVAEIKALGGQAIAVVGDVTAEGYAQRLVKETVEAFGPSLDILVNNAGYTWDGTVHKMTDSQWQAMLDIHISAPFKIIRAAAPYMRDVAAREKQETGRARIRKIINISSVAGLDGNFGQANYSSAKAAVVGLTKTLAREWGPFNILVNCVAFGFIETRLTQAKEKGEIIDREGSQVPIGVPEKIRQMFTLLCPLGRPATPEEAAAGLLMVASPLADYITGEVIRVTGGM